MSKEILLDVRNLSVSFPHSTDKTIAVDNVSFQLSKGESLGIVGESGSGKSVTALSILRLLDFENAQSKGEIIYKLNDREVNLFELKPKALQNIRGKEISMIFQEPMTSLNPVFTCGNQVSESLIHHFGYSKKQAKKETISLFEKVMLPQPELIYDTYPHQISGGQKQRVMIAMAIACKPKILIADEPTTALDVTVQKGILELIKHLQKDTGMSIIFISHDLGVISKICDRTMVMLNGKIVEQGNTQTLFEHPKHPYTKGLQACKPQLGIKVEKLPVISDFMKILPDGSVIEKSTDELTIRPKKTKENTVAHKENDPILSIKNLNTTFNLSKGLFSTSKRIVKAVHNVSLEVFKGETLGLVGESGCGKTTLGRAILRLVEPNSGEIFFDKKNLLKLSENEMRAVRKDIQMVFQDPYSSLNPRIKIGNAILEALQVHQLYKTKNQRREKAVELLETVGLQAEHFYRYPHEFSGGQRQRICIARALAVEPKFLICDEIVSALDVSVQAQILNLLNELKQKHQLTYIFISHDLSVIHHISDRVAVMKEGKILEIGTPEEIFDKPKNVYTQNLINAIF